MLLVKYISSQFSNGRLLRDCSLSFSLPLWDDLWTAVCGGGGGISVFKIPFCALLWLVKQKTKAAMMVSLSIIVLRWIT